MSTIIGEAFFVLIGNGDIMLILFAYLMALSILYAVLASWSYKR